MRHIALLFLAMLSAAQGASAAIDFKQNSVLAEGKWVKVKVGRNGVYELSAGQLESFGFSDPEKVKVFGLGGEVATDNFTVTFTDDLEQVPAMRKDGKIYFYAKGIRKETVNISSYTDFDIYTSLTTNPYSSDSYYFLTDRDDIAPLAINNVETTQEQLQNAVKWQEQGVEFWAHEQDITNLTRSGKQFLGEDYVQTGEIDFDVPVPELAEGNLQIYAVTAVKTPVDCSGKLTVNGVDAVIEDNGMKANAHDNALQYSNFDLYGKIPVSDISPDGASISVKLSLSPANPTIARLDYLTLGYPAYNAIPADSASIRRYIRLKANEGIVIKAPTSTTHVWLVDDSAATIKQKVYETAEYVLSADDDGNGRFLPDRLTNDWGEFVCFDTQKTQGIPEFVEVVENQNLHALPTPDMLIITNAALREQAERVADYHRRSDGMEVLVLDHNLIFNEFSAGCRDAMAYRRIAKKLYQDKTGKELRYLLLFGGGTYDNRQLLSGKDTDMLLTYQSTESTHDVNSYSTDDFFGIFSESSTSLDSSPMNIAVGRIQFISEPDMKNYVDKLLAYMQHKDDEKSAWRNNMLLIGESGDEYIHANQCESFISKFKESEAYDMNINKIYMEAYSDVADTRKKFVENLEQGQNFVLFIGHSNIANMTQSMILMDIQKAIETKYEVPPIMYFSSCDVGRFDIGQTSFIDELMSNSQGGIIAAIAATRQAYTNLNGRLTDSFAKYMGKAPENYIDGMTIGRVLMYAKNYCSEYTKNRRKYHLLGDPAMKIKLPENKVRVTAVNGKTDGSTVTVGPLEKLTLTGVVTGKDGATDTGFDGYVRIALYDADRNYMKTKVNNVSVQLTERGAEAVVSGAEVTDGVFSAEIVIPERLTTDNDTIPLRLTAVAADGSEIASGLCNALLFARSDSFQPDGTAPQINAMYIGEKASFNDGQTVNGDIKIIAEVTDDTALLTTGEIVLTTTYLSLDGGQRTYHAETVAESAAKATLSVPLYDLSPGFHTAKLLVSDLSGNTAVRTISFFVENGETMEVAIEETAVRETATISIVSENGTAADTADIRIINDNGTILFSAQSVSLPYRWDGNDNNGIRLPAGVYNLHATTGGIAVPAKKIVVTKQ